MGDAERKRDEEMNALLDDLDELLLDDLDELLSSDFIKEASQRGFICEIALRLPRSTRAPRQPTATDFVKSRGNCSQGAKSKSRLP
jgi:hypothetical protein